jgi:hypothetical protein
MLKGQSERNKPLESYKSQHQPNEEGSTTLYQEAHSKQEPPGSNSVHQQITSKFVMQQ